MIPNRWHRETDVLIVGYGSAGAVAAITAHDRGAATLILEKAPHPGGISITPPHGGVKFVGEDKAGALKYFAALSGGRVEPELVEAFVSGLAGNLVFIRELAKINNAEIGYSAFKGGTYPLEGGQNLTSFQVNRVPGFSGFPWTDEFRGSQNLFKVLLDNVEARRIPSLLDTPVAELITDDNDAVVGAKARQKGETINIKARKAVILATGGYEQNEWLRTHVFEGVPIYSSAPLTHTGDGVLMAQKAGAALWHMWHVHGTYGFKFPEVPVAYVHSYRGPRDARNIMPWIVVDKFGKRYMNECPPIPFDTPFRNMQLFNPDIPGYGYIPSYMILDDVGLKMGPLGIRDSYGYEKWGHDNAREIDRGWIKVANTVSELAQKLKALPENGGRMDAAILENTVQGWNTIVAEGKDPLGRLASTMLAVKKPPFYGVQLWPVIHYTQGGPVHDAQRRILDSFRRPILRLYSAGQLGSFFGHLYQAGGNLGECLASGRTSGADAAAEDPWC